MRPIHNNFTMQAASANGICLSQKPLAAGFLILNGALKSTEMNTAVLPSAARTVVVMDAYRRVSIASDANDSGRIFTLTGKNPADAVFSESLAGPNAAAVSSLNSFAKLISISVDAATAGNVTVGTNGAADTPWMPMPYIGLGVPFELMLQVKFSPDANMVWQWQGSASDPENGSIDSEKVATNLESAFIASGMATFNGAPLTLVRGTVDSYVAGGVVYSIIKTS